MNDLREENRRLLSEFEDSLQLNYCGVYWSYWLARYLVAASWGVDIDMDKLTLMYLYCRHGALLGTVEREDRVHEPVIIPKPTTIRWSKNRVTDGFLGLPVYELHSDGSPAIDGYLGPVYCFHNVKIPARMGEVKSSEWKPEWIIDEENAEVRAILIQELGVERVRDRGVLVDDYKNHTNRPDYIWLEKSKYELVDMSELFETLDKALYLGMTNQTTGAYHLEAVTNDCETIVDALSLRLGMDFNNYEIGSIQ